MTTGESRAEFSETERSINGTGESLHKGKYQLGFSDLYFGATDYITVGIPTLSIVAGRGAVELRKKIDISDRWRMTPSISAGPVPFPDQVVKKLGFSSDLPRPYYQVGSDFGVDLGDNRQHSLNLGLDFRVTNRVTRDGRSRRRYLGDIRSEYDFYTGGNLFYVGFQRLLPYAGFTWAWKKVHIGVISSPLSYFIPFPYCYLRF